MKFYLHVEHPTLGNVRSETYEGTDKEYHKIIDDMLKNNLGKLDFYTENGSFVVISEEICKNSLVYLKIDK